jgi:Proteasome subunit
LFNIHYDEDVRLLEPWLRLFKLFQVFIEFNLNFIYIFTPLRNAFLSEKGLPLPNATSTGTTIVGCLFKDGIVLGADTRATEGPIVADKNCEKVLFTFPVFAAGANNDRDARSII